MNLQKNCNTMYSLDFFLQWELLFNEVKNANVYKIFIIVFNSGTWPAIIEPFWDNNINLHLNDTICTDKISLPALLTYPELLLGCKG